MQLSFPNLKRYGILIDTASVCRLLLLLLFAVFTENRSRGTGSFHNFIELYYIVFSTTGLDFDIMRLVDVIFRS